MKTLIILLICLCLGNAIIYADDFSVTYDYDGDPKIYHTFLAL